MLAVRAAASARALDTACRVLAYSVGAAQAMAAAESLESATLASLLRGVRARPPAALRGGSGLNGAPDRCRSARTRSCVWRRGCSPREASRAPAGTAAAGTAAHCDAAARILSRSSSRLRLRYEATSSDAASSAASRAVLPAACDSGGMASGAISLAERAVWLHTAWW